MWSIPLDGGIRGFREVKIGCWGEPALVPTSKSHTEKKMESKYLLRFIYYVKPRKIEKNFHLKVPKP